MNDIVASDTITRLTAEVESKNAQFQLYARRMEADLNAALAEVGRLRGALARIENEGDGTHAVALARVALSLILPLTEKP